MDKLRNYVESDLQLNAVKIFVQYENWLAIPNLNGSFIDDLLKVIGELTHRCIERHDLNLFVAS